MSEKVNSSSDEDVAEFVDVHGQAVPYEILQQTHADDIGVPLTSVKRAGFTIYKKNKYNKLLVSDKEIRKDFDMFMLSAATEYLLEKQFGFSDEKVEESYKRLKKQLVISEASSSYCNENKESRNKNNIFLQSGRVVEHSRGGDDFQIRICNKKVTPEKNQQATKKSFDKPNQGNPSSPPKHIINNFTLSTLNLNEQYKATVTHTTITTNLIYVQIEKNEDILAEIFEKAADQALVSKTIDDFQVNEIYLAKGEGEEHWLRCKIVGGNPCKGFYIDYGNVAPLTEVKEISAELAAIPAQAVRLYLSPPPTKKLEVEDEIIVQPYKYNTIGYVARIVEDHRPSPRSSPSEAILQIPDYICHIQNGQRVIILAEENCTFYLRTQECFIKLREIQQGIDDLVASDTTPIENIRRGQLVLSQKCNEEKYYRAIVRKIESDDLVRVKYLDFNETACVNSKLLLNISAQLAKQPITYFLSPSVLNRFNVSVLNEKCRKLIRDCCKNRSKFTVVYEGRKKFDLIGNDGGKSYSLTEKLESLTAQSVAIEDDDDW